MKKIAFVVSTPTTADAFLKGHIAALSKHYKIDLIANYPQDYKSTIIDSQKIFVPIHRNIHIWKDLIALITLIRIFSNNNYDAVHSVTPKAGLLSMFAAWISRIPVRHHTFTGQVWATKKGFSRKALRFLDKITDTLSTKSLVDSHSQREFLLNEKVIKKSKSFVLENGSISGVNLHRFKPDPKKREQIRYKHGIKNDEFIFLFLGRINKEKGVPELVSAFRNISNKYSNIRLMIVGRDEANIFNDGNIENSFNGKLIRVDFTTEAEAYFNAADVFCLPSHREGFGSVIIEAAACRVPSIASNIYGISDAVVDGVTGLLHQPGSDKEIENCLEKLFLNTTLRNSLAENALERAQSEFSSELLESALVNFYENSIKNEMT